MLRKLFYLVSVFVVVGLIGPVAAQEVDMEIGFATPVIDGQVDEIWAGASTQYMVPLGDPTNASGSWMALYDSENLYVIVDMTDDSLQNDSDGSWQDDSVELYFDGGNTKVNTPLSGDDHQYTFAWTTDEIQGTNIEGATEGIEHAQVDTDTGWRIEIKLPWLSIQGAAPQGGDLIGIDCYYNDDDDGGDSREGKMLTFSAVEGWNDASQWGTAILAAIPETEPVDPGSDGLVAYYALDNDTTDSSGNGLDGVVVGDPNFVDGVEGMALDFNGDDYVDCNGVAEFSFTESMTVSAWVNIRSVTTAWMAMVAKGENAWRLGVNNLTTGIHYGFTGGTRNWQAANSATELPFDEWHHVAATYDTNVGALVYIDGVLDASNPDLGGVATNEMPLLLGENPEAAGRLFDGMLDEITIYNRALSEYEILYLAGERAAPVDPGSDGMVAYYALENDANDSSGNGLDGTIVGDPNFVEGAVGMGLQLDGVDDYVDLGNDPLFDLTEQVTLAAWVNVNDIGNGENDPWVGKGDTSYMLKGHRDGNQIEFFIYDGGWVTVHADVGAEFNGEWHHAAGTFDGEKLIIYVDGEVGVSVAYEGIGIVPNTYNVAIGSNTQASGRFSEGIHDEVMIYNKALSQGEIRYLAGFRSNLVQNPSFEEDEAVLDDPDWENWCTWNPAEGAGSNATIVDTDSVDGVRSLKIEPVGAENWYFIVLSLPIPVDMDKVYTTSFWAKAEEPRPLTVQMKAADNSISEWNSTTFDLTTEWAEYSYTSEVLIESIKLEILCAGSEVPFLLDSFSVVKSGNVPPAPPAPPLVPGENILVNGGFEDGVMDPWSTYGNVTTEVVSELADANVPEAPIEGAYCLHVVVPEAGANSWDAGLQNAGHVFEAGKQYTLSANVKSKAGTLDIHFKPERAADPWEGYNDTTFTMTEEWTEFSVETGVIPADVDPASITFHIGFAPGDFWIDDVKFSELLPE